MFVHASSLACLHVCICINGSMCMCMCLHMYVCMHVCACLCVSVCTHEDLSECICICVRICIYAYMYSVCMYACSGVAASI